MIQKRIKGFISPGLFCTKTLIMQVALAFMGTASGSRFAAVRPRYCKKSIERRESSGEANKYKGMNDVYVTHVITHRFVYAHTHTYIYIYIILDIDAVQGCKMRL